MGAAMTKGTDCRRPSLRRIALLLALGVTSGVALTAPGKYAVKRWIWEPSPPSDTLSPQWLLPGAVSRRSEALRAFNHFNYRGDDVEREVPTTEAVAQRLAGIDGWSTAVLCELGASPGELYRAGIDVPTCVLLVRPPYLGRMRTDWQCSGPIRQWQIILLDAADREVGRTYMSDLRPGFSRTDGGENLFEPAEGAPGDGELSVVRVFHRTESGEIRTG